MLKVSLVISKRCHVMSSHVMSDLFYFLFIYTGSPIRIAGLQGGPV